MPVPTFGVPVCAVQPEIFNGVWNTIITLGEREAAPVGSMLRVSVVALLGCLCMKFQASNVSTKYGVGLAHSQMKARLV